MPPLPSVPRTDPTAVQLPKIAIAALTSIPDYNIDPLLLKGLRRNLAQAVAAEKTIKASLDEQRTRLTALRGNAGELRAEARRAHQAAATASTQFRVAVSTSYMSESGLSPTVDALFSPGTRSPNDVIYSADIMGLYAKSQSVHLEAALGQMNRVSVAADAAFASANGATKHLLATRQKDLAAKQLTQQVLAKIKARIIAVRKDLAAKRAAQAAVSGTSVTLWKGYLTALGLYGVKPPTAASLRNPNHLPHGMRPIRDSAGVAQRGIAKIRTAHGDVVILPREVIAAIGFAYAQLGKPYVWAAEGPNSFDCSGLTLAAYRSAGITAMPRIAADQYTWTTRVRPGAEMPGDLVFFAGSDGTMTHPGHVALVIDPVRHLMIQAPQTGDVVKISDYSKWPGLVGFGRVTTAG